MAKPHPIERALLEMMTVIKAISARQLVVERALLALGSGRPMPADVMFQLNETVRNAEVARDLTLAGKLPTHKPHGGRFG